MIADQWTVDEILDAMSLDELEGAGQAKRLTARLCAEFHNAVQLATWATHGEKGSQAPKRMSETVFLPVRQAKPASDGRSAEQQQRDQVAKDVDSVLRGMFGY